MADSFRDAGHLPKQRAGGQPADPAGLPRQRKGVTPQRHGRYPDYNVLANAEHWDPVTRELIESRAREVPPIRFFTAVEAACGRAFCDVVTAQDAEPRIPVMEMVDKRYTQGKLDGYRYDDMPDDRETWRLVLRGLDEAAAPDRFAAAAPERQRQIVERFAGGELSGGAWEQLNVSRAWSVVMRVVLSAFYSHPWAWNEIGFGGPAYPRGYMRLAVGPTGRDPSEALEAFGPDPVEDVPQRGLE
jgi:gluconate 2-dehydrogenase subunit 3-like protein